MSEERFDAAPRGDLSHVDVAQGTRVNPSSVDDSHAHGSSADRPAGILMPC